MASVLLQLDTFKFHIDSAAYSELVKKWQWRWSGQNVIGHSDVMHCTGKAPITVSLQGEIAPTLRNVGTRQIEDLAALGDEMRPLLMISGEGEILGYWCMTDLSETNTKFVKQGLPRLQAFSLELSFYGDYL